MTLPTIGGSQIVLRPFRRSDAALLAREVVDPDIVRWLDIELPYTLADGEEFIAGTEAAWRDRSGAHFVIAERRDGPLRGYIGALSVEDQMRVVEVVYWVIAGARGRGLARRSLRLLLDWLPEAIGPERIELGMVDGNEASARVAESCGFVLREVRAGEAILDDEPADERIYEYPRS